MPNYTNNISNTSQKVETTTHKQDHKNSTTHRHIGKHKTHKDTHSNHAISQRMGMVHIVRTTLIMTCIMIRSIKFNRSIGPNRATRGSRERQRGIYYHHRNKDGETSTDYGDEGSEQTQRDIVQRTTMIRTTISRQSGRNIAMIATILPRRRRQIANSP